MSERVSAMVLNYNGRHLLETALPSFAKQTYGDCAVYVVDNGSTDDSLEWLQQNWPQVQVVSLPRNVGVTAALNVCVDAARGELIGLFNNDIECEPQAVAELVAALDAHPEAGSACAKLVDFHDRTVIDGAGDLYRWTGEANRRGQGERDRGQYERPQAVFGACGGAALYRRTAFDEVGRFDERFGAIYEDVDWSFRAQLLGWSCRYVPQAVVYHMGSATLGRELSDFTLYQNLRNGIWVVAKNYPASALVRRAPSLLRWQLLNLLWTARPRRVHVWLRVWRDALRGMPGVLARRREIQRTRRAGRRELEAVVE
jgi:GT2 family glycosyltransferase